VSKPTAVAGLPPITPHDEDRCPLAFDGARCLKSVGHDGNHRAHLGGQRFHDWYATLPRRITGEAPGWQGTRALHERVSGGPSGGITNGQDREPQPPAGRHSTPNACES